MPVIYADFACMLPGSCQVCGLFQHLGLMKQTTVHSQAAPNLYLGIDIMSMSTAVSQLVVSMMGNHGVQNSYICVWHDTLL